jgi:hypothetical protein
MEAPTRISRFALEIKRTLLALFKLPGTSLPRPFFCKLLIPVIAVVREHDRIYKIACKLYNKPEISDTSRHGVIVGAHQKLEWIAVINLLLTLKWLVESVWPVLWKSCANMDRDAMELLLDKLEM